MRGKVGIVGHRSWIGQALITELRTAGYQPIIIGKEDAKILYTRDMDCLFIIPGRLNQSPSENLYEIDLVARIATNPLACRRQVLLGSQARPWTSYGRHKQHVERAFLGERPLSDDMRTIVVRPGAVFGPGQSIDSPMLIPSLVREGVDLQLREPGHMTSFVHVRDLVRHMVMCVCSEPPTGIPGSFDLYPYQVRDLYETFNLMRAKAAPDE